MAGLGMGVGLGVGGSGGGGAALVPSSTSFLNTASNGAIIASLNDPYAGLNLGTTTYETYGVVAPQLALSGGNITRTSSAVAVGTAYAVNILATSGDGKRKVGENLVFTARAPSNVPSISFALTNVTIPEGNSGTNTVVSNTINVNRNGLTGAIVIDLTYGGVAQNNVDYSGALSSVTVPAGQNSVSFDISVIGDNTVETDELLTITARPAGFPDVSAVKNITITNDDVNPNVVVTQDWRVPITAVYDSSNVSSVTTALLASPSAKTLPQVPFTAGATRTLGWTIGAIASPGGIFYYIPIGGYSTLDSSNVPVAALEESLDSTNYVDGTWNVLTRQPIAPSGRVGDRFGAVGQAMFIPAGPAGRKLRFRTTGGTGGGTCRFGIFQLQSNPERNNVHIFVGDSTVAGIDVAVTIQYLQTTFPGSDPILFNLGRGGGGTQTFIQETLPLLDDNYTWAPRVILNGSINDVTAFRPYNTDAQNALPRIDGYGRTLIQGLRSRGKTIINAASINFSNYPADSGRSLPAQNVFERVDISTMPYNTNLLYPLYKELIPEGWNFETDSPLGDRAMAWSDHPETATDPDGIHGGRYSADSVTVAAYRPVFDKAFGVTVNNWLDLAIVRSSPQTEPARKQRLLDMFANSYAPTSTATAKRQSQLTAINAISTVYSEPSLTSPAISPSTLTYGAGDFWLDAGPWGSFIKLNDGKVTSWIDRWNNYKFTGPSASPWQRPAWREKTPGSQRPHVFAEGFNAGSDGADYLLAEDSAVIGALNAANQPFTLHVTAFGAAVNLRSLMAWTDLLIQQQANGTQRLNAIGFGSTTLVDGVTADTPALNTLFIYTLVYDGTTARWYRNGTLVATQSWTKAATTGASMRLFGDVAFNQPWAGGLCEIIFQKTAHTDATRQAIIAYLKQKWTIA